VAVLAVLWWVEKRSRKKWNFFLCVTWWHTRPRSLMGSGSGWVAVVPLERGDGGGSNGTGYNLAVAKLALCSDNLYPTYPNLTKKPSNTSKTSKNASKNTSKTPEIDRLPPILSILSPGCWLSIRNAGQRCVFIVFLSFF
jgi:hypothetical protein